MEKREEKVTLAAPVTHTGLRLYRIVAVSFGLMCVLQAALNICLRLALTEDSSTRELQERLGRFTDESHNGWLYFRNSFYYVSSIKKTWHDSQSDCLQRGADLVIIDSRGEQDFIRRQKQMMWIGLSKSDGVWKWVDGTLLNASYWCSGEPNNLENRGEYCGETFPCKQEYNWNDEGCDSVRLWICEKKII